MKLDDHLSTMKDPSYTAPSAQGQIDPLLSALGEEVWVVHPMKEGESASGGGDIDCVVQKMDPSWPLRVPAPWRLVQCVRYDITGWQWKLEKNGQLVTIDTLIDPLGIGTYGFPTGLVQRFKPDRLDAVRASYLTAKRARKDIGDPSEWAAIRDLARSDPSSYQSSLRAVFGKKISDRIGAAVLEGRVPHAALRAEAKVALSRRRFGSPRRLLRSVGSSAARLGNRSFRPTGMYIVLAGPDGTGKSTLAEELPKGMEEVFRKFNHFHWRPDVLPRLGAFLGRPVGDPSKVHERPPHRKGVSLFATFYYWTDFQIGSWFKVLPHKVRNGLTILERGWWDIAVDRRRYRLAVSDRFVRALGRFLPRPDLVLILKAPASVLVERKGELSEHEAERQLQAWNEVIPPKIRAARINTTLPQQDVAEAARSAIYDAMSDRSYARLGAGWVNLPTSRRARWFLPRGPRKVARTGLSIYQPVTPVGRLGWELARLACSAGVWRLTPRGEAIPRAVREALAAHLPPRSTVAAMRANHPGRFIALVIGEDGSPRAVAKIASGPAGREALEMEARALIELGTLLPAPLRAPEVLIAEEGLLLMQPIEWRPRSRPWCLPREVAHGLGVMFREGSKHEGAGPAHGDCAPWNLLRSKDGWTLVDWEAATVDAPPYFDLFHYVVQAHVLLRRRPAAELVQELRTRSGHAGIALEAYAEGAGLKADAALEHLRTYLDVSIRSFDQDSPSGRAAVTTRRELQAALGS